jgi:hypothetical protein
MRQAAPLWSLSMILHPEAAPAAHRLVAKDCLRLLAMFERRVQS